MVPGWSLSIDGGDGRRWLPRHGAYGGGGGGVLP